ncbi:MAG: cytochrome c [Nitrospiraceae bacterium]|nr:MAG: cytochrome c [Nitrospiraceae bacterium]
MSIFFIKSILSLALVIVAAVDMLAMFEVFGRNERKYNPETLKKIHRAAGILYLIVFSVITFLCLRFIYLTKTELSVRGTFHGVFALAIVILMAVKVMYIRTYKQFYNHAKVFGVLIALFTFGTAGVSAGYYLLVSEFGTEKSYDRIIQYKERAVMPKREKQDIRKQPAIMTDPESIGRGKNIFDSRCKFCHDAYSMDTVVGPGLKRILKNAELPASRRPATPENIREQFIHPFSRMPSFENLSDEEVEDIIAFLNTL